MMLRLPAPTIYGYDAPLPTGVPRWIIHMMVDVRQDCDIGRQVNFRVAGRSWRDTLEQAVLQAVSQLAWIYRRELADTPYRLFPRRTSSGVLCAPRSFDAEHDETLYQMIVHAHCLETRNGELHQEVDALWRDKKRHLKEIQDLRAQIPADKSAKVSRSNPRGYWTRGRARKSVIMRYERVSVELQHDAPLLINEPPLDLVDADQLALEPVQEPELMEEEPQ